MSRMRSSGGMNFPSAVNNVVFPVPVPPLNKRLRALQHTVFEAIGDSAVECSTANEIFEFEAVGTELADGQSDAAQTARRDDSRDAAAVREARIEYRFCFRNIISQPPCDVLHRDGQRAFTQSDAGGAVR